MRKADFSCLVTRYQSIYMSKCHLVLTAGKRLEKGEFLGMSKGGKWPQHSGCPTDGVGWWWTGLGVQDIPSTEWCQFNWLLAVLLPRMVGDPDDLVAPWQCSAASGQRGSPSTGGTSTVVINCLCTAWSRNAMSQALMSLGCFGRTGRRGTLGAVEICDRLEMSRED